jgi:hypothetical protein
MKLTEKQKDVLALFESMPEGSYLTPTEVGMGCGKPWHSASSWASGPLQKFVSAEIMRRTDRATYGLTEAGRNFVKREKVPA